MRSNTTLANIVALATAVPEHVIDQAAAADLARHAFAGRMPEYDRLARVFASTGVERRHTVVPVAWFSEPHDWVERTEAYVRGASELFIRVTTDALHAAALQPSDIDAVVFVSSTGISTPSIDARLLPQLGLRPDTMRVPVFGLGCAGGVSGLALAARLASSRPDSNVLFVAIELCSLAFRTDRATKTDVIATSLFADGAAAAIVRADGERGLAIANSTEHQWPDTLDIMGWSVDPAGLGVALSRSLPAFVTSRFRAVYDAALGRFGLEAPEVGRVVCHPGGTRVLSALEAALDAEAGTLDHERTIMRDYGNMSAPTVLFVLERAMRAGLPPTALLAALGPGFTASFIALENAA